MLVSVVEPRTTRASNPKTLEDEEASPEADAAPAKQQGAATAASGAILKDGKENVGGVGSADSKANGAAKGDAERASEQGLEMSKSSRSAHRCAAFGAVSPDNGDRRVAFAAGDRGDALDTGDARAPAHSSPFFNTSVSSASEKRVGDGLADKPSPFYGRAHSAASHRAAPSETSKAGEQPAARLGGAVADAFVGTGRVLGGMLWVMWRMLHIPSFAIIMVEHIIGNLQTISGYKIIYFQARQINVELLQSVVLGN